ncbi:MAG: Na/Pi cotransporter family protein [Clostridia bacterium]|nr:Na/Pi cotransporter family protein [Clostridia bacterium]
MSFVNILTLLGGLAMFLYGMNTMGDGLEKVAGKKMGQIIDRLTGSLFKGLLVGTLVTAIIQSSNATLVMVVGFVNAGLMTLSQSVGVMLGAHIGTTITSVIVSLNGIGDSLWFLQLFKPSTLAPVALAAGIVLIMFVKTNKAINIGTILAGFGILFLGMDAMSGAMSGLNELPWFQPFMESLKNPVLGILVGLLLTVVIQSSSASIGILQAAAITGAISFPTAAAMVLGCNVGSCVAALMSSMGANKDSKRAAILNSFFMVGGMLIASILLWVCGLGPHLPMNLWNLPATMFNISGFHIAFNIFNSLIMIALSKPLVSLVVFLVKDDGKEEDEEYRLSLDLRLLNTPTLAINQTRREIVNMMMLSRESVNMCYKNLIGEASYSAEEVHAKETLVDRYESDITQYLMRLTDRSMTDTDSAAVTTMLHVINDAERIGDHAYIIAKSYDRLTELPPITEKGMKQLVNMYKAVEKLMDMTVQAFEAEDVRLASAVHPLEDVVDYLEDNLRSEHLERLSNRECNYETGIVFLDIVNSLERISAYCSNISLAVEQMNSNSAANFDPHKHLKLVHENKSDEYMRVYDKYIEKYTR